MQRIAPTLSMQIVKTDDGDFGVDMHFRGLGTEDMAAKVFAMMQEHFCGPEIELVDGANNA